MPGKAEVGNGSAAGSGVKQRKRDERYFLGSQDWTRKAQYVPRVEGEREAL